MQKLLLVLVLGIIPWILGLPWTKMMKSKCPVVAAYGIGYFVELALFHVVAFTGTVTYTPFHVIANIYSIVLLIAVVLSCFYSYRHNLFSKRKNIREWKKYSWYEWVIILVFIVSFSIQIIRGFTYDITYMSYDDAIYTTYASDTLQVDRIGIIDSYTGSGRTLLLDRIMQTSLVFPSYLSIISGVSVVTIEHTFQYVQLIVLAYTIYYYMADELFDKRENKLLFISFISLFYIFGYHSHYSLTFRLLGPNYQGKAILAVSLTPLIFIFLTRKLSEPYDWKSGMLLSLFSLSAVSLTLWGIGTMLAIVMIPVTLSLFRKERQWKHLYYLFWGLVAPMGFMSYYILYKIGV